MPRAVRSGILGASALLISWSLGAAPATTKSSLTHRDYDGWRRIGSLALSRDGRNLAYSYMPEEGDGELVIRDLKSGRETREPAGSLPPPAPPTEEANPEAPPVQSNVRILFTGDSRFIVATTFPTKAERDKAKGQRRPAENPKEGLVIVDLSSREAVRVGSVKSVQVAAKGGPWVAFLREPKTEGPPDAAGPEARAPGERESGPTGARARPSRGPAARTEYGTDLVLRDLSRPGGDERVVANVVEYALSRDGHTLLYTVSSKNEAENGVFAIVPGTSEAPVGLLQGKGKYAKLTWDREQTKAAFVSDRDDSAAKVPTFKVFLWQRGEPTAAEVVSTATPAFPKGLYPTDKGSLGFSRDGRKLYVPAAPPPRPAKGEVETPAEDKVLADLWHWRDEFIQPMQRVRASQDLNRTYRGIYHIAERRYVQLADPSVRIIWPSDDGRHALGIDDAPYRRTADYDGSYGDVYLLDTSTADRKLVLKRFRQGPASGGARLQWSPNGNFVFYFNDRHWHLFDVAEGSSRNVTASLGVAFYDERHDTPDPPGSYGSAGWTKDSQSFLLYDRYDVWQVFVDGRPPRNLTRGEGRRSSIAFRVQRAEPPQGEGRLVPGGIIVLTQEEEEDGGIELTKPLLLRGENEETRATGFFRAGFDGSAPPKQLLWGERNHRIVARATDADVLLLSASRFDEYPDVHATDSSFRALTKVTNGGAQKDRFWWGTGELVSFKNTDGVPLKAALYKPENFDPKKRYPLLVYIYERLSQNVHNFVDPRPMHSINFSYYVSNGYLVLTPDIVYTIGNPGQSALKAVLPAVEAVVDMGFVNEAAIGIQGHSWGGYQIAYMITQTQRFRAAEAGAPVANMTSAYSGIRWGSGMPRQFQYETSQSRIARPLYEAPYKYIENSAVFHAERVQTPLLILHDDQDDAVPWYQGIELYLALRRTGKEVYLFNYNGEFHGLRRRQDQKDYTARMQQFFDHFLKGVPAPEWMEKGIPYLEREEEKERFQRVLDQ